MNIKSRRYYAVDAIGMTSRPMHEHSMNMSRKPWIGVDLDGTLAKHPSEDNGFAIGLPIKPMVDRVKSWLNQGVCVKIMTARAHPENPRFFQDLVEINKFCMTNFGQELDVTCCKDYNMMQLWDDRAVAVEMDTGKIKEQHDDKQLNLF